MKHCHRFLKALHPIISSHSVGLPILDSLFWICNL